MGAATFIGSVGWYAGAYAEFRNVPELVLPDAIIFLSRESAKTKRTKGLKFKNQNVTAQSYHHQKTEVPFGRKYPFSAAQAVT